MKPCRWRFGSSKPSSGDDGDSPMLPGGLNRIPEGARIGTVTADGGAAIIPIRKTGHPWKEDGLAAIARNETLRAMRHHGRAFWKRWIEAKLPSPARLSWTNCVRRLTTAILGSPRGGGARCAGSSANERSLHDATLANRHLGGAAREREGMDRVHPRDQRRSRSEGDISACASVARAPRCGMRRRNGEAPPFPWGGGCHPLLSLSLILR